MNDNHEKGTFGAYIMKCVVCTVKPRYTASFRPNLDFYFVFLFPFTTFIYRQYLACSEGISGHEGVSRFDCTMHQYMTDYTDCN